MPEAFDRAVETARGSIPVQQRIVKPEYWSAHVIVRHNGEFRVFKESAWVKPTETPLLPWTPPEGERVALVDLDGEVHMLTDTLAA